jgi:hypothetical protein
MMIESCDGRLTGRWCGDATRSAASGALLTQKGKEPKAPLFLLIDGDGGGSALPRFKEFRGSAFSGAVEDLQNLPFWSSGVENSGFSGAVEDLHISMPRASWARCERGDSRLIAES